MTGSNKYNDFERLQNLQNESYSVHQWISNEWGSILSKADLVVSRAGINILSELALLSKPTLLVPIPYLYQNEQNKNAKYFENLGLARILPQSKLSGETLFKEINFMLNNLDNLKEKARQAKKAIIPDAAKRLTLEVILLCLKEEKITGI